MSTSTSTLRGGASVPRRRLRSRSWAIVGAYGTIAAIAALAAVLAYRAELLAAEA